MGKSADTTLDIHPLIKKRWSPRAFKTDAIEKEKLERMIEAARWSASCRNEQPWRFIIGLNQQSPAYDKIFSCLDEGNQVWVKSVPCLILILMKKTYSHNGKENKWAKYDCGQAAAYLSIQALEEGLYVHQMAGFNQDKIKKVFRLTDDLEPVSVIAAGYRDSADILPDDLKKTELAPRKRLPMKELIIESSISSHKI